MNIIKETNEININDRLTVSLDEKTPAVVAIDQTLLPGSVKIIRLTQAKEIWDAIYLLKVRGAPAIGVAAAYGIYVLAFDIAKHAKDADAFYKEYKEMSDYLNSSRPTAVNLSWALARMNETCKRSLEKDSNIGVTLTALHDEACAIQQEDIDTCRKIGEYGLSLIKPGCGILTHCNAGSLATRMYGTATAPIYLAHEKGYDIKVYADETRPLLQGARLTAYELANAGIDVTLLCDNMCASLMRSGKINAVFVGCDRVAANGDVANKIGTSVVATVAKRYDIPFYVCAPTSTIDPKTPTGDDIVIEQRDPDEVTTMWYKERMAPEGINVYNPAFDVTDHELITAIITENGIFREYDFKEI